MEPTTRERLILALDVPSGEDALALADATRDYVGCMKVGLRLFTTEGPDLVRRLKAEGHRIFLDLKFHDIPNTVADASRSATALGADFFTVHASGGPEMLRAALEASRDEAERSGKTTPTVLAVTVLTSLPATAGEVVARARTAWEAGIRGVVSSPREARELRDALGAEAVIVTPGIRPSWSRDGDQRRTATASDAIAAGATHIVVGRPIRDADDPRDAARRIGEEIEAVPAKRA